MVALPTAVTHVGDELAKYQASYLEKFGGNFLPLYIFVSIFFFLLDLEKFSLPCGQYAAFETLIAVSSSSSSFETLIATFASSLPSLYCIRSVT